MFGNVAYHVTTATSTMGNQPCVDGHTGLFCAACEDTLVRDAPTLPCSSCDAVDATWVLFVNTNIDLASKAMWGLFIAYRMMRNAVSTSALDAILIRIFAHFAVT